MAYHCSRIIEEQRGQWEKLAGNSSAGGFHQSFNWAAFKRADGWDTYKIGLFNDEDELVGGAVLLQFHFNSTRTNFLYIPEGPILDYSNEDNLNEQWRVLETAILSIVDASKSAKTTHIRIEPRISECPEWFLSKFRKAPLNLQPKHTLVVDISTSEDEILAQMKQKGRYNIRLAGKKGVSISQVSEVSDKDRKRFFELYSQTFNRNEFEGKEEDLFINLMPNCKDISKLFFAEYEGKTLATAYVIYFGGRATYLYGASSNENREVMAPYLLHWEIMKDAKASGYKEYDFWGIAPESAPDHKWQGITSFKKKFGGTQPSFIGAYDYIIQKDLYEAFLGKHEL